MKLYKFSIKTLAVLFIILVGVACEEDFGEVGTGIVGEVNFETQVAEFDVTSYSVTYPEGVQTNALGVGALGFYRDNVYGDINASVLTQLRISRGNPDFGDETVLDSVVLTLPYFSTQVGSDGEEIEYELDSIFGNRPIKLTAFRSNFFLNDLDPDTDFEDPAIYNSNDLSTFPGIEGDTIFHIAEFIPSNEEIILKAVDTTSEDGFSISRIPPALRVKLDSLYWNEQIIDREGDDVLLNQNNFNDYFRGVYFKAEAIDGSGTYFLFDFADADITMFYNFEGTDDSTQQGEADDNLGTIAFGFAGVQVVGFDQNVDPSIVADIENADTIEGEENLYLQGGEGSIAVIDFFGIDDDNGDGIEDEEGVDENDVPEILEALRSCGVIINEANLIMYVDQQEIDANSGTAEPERLFVYNYENNTTIIDANFDASAGNDGPVSIRTNHLGRLSREREGDLTSPGVSYKIKLTRHINDIVNRDSTNVRLAVSVSQNVTELNTSIIAGTGEPEDAKRVPVAGVISPEGTIIHGNLSEDQEKRLKLRIFYTVTGEELSSECRAILGIE